MSGGGTGNGPHARPGRDAGDLGHPVAAPDSERGLIVVLLRTVRERALLLAAQPRRSRSVAAFITTEHAPAPLQAAPARHHEPSPSGERRQRYRSSLARTTRRRSAGTTASRRASSTTVPLPAATGVDGDGGRETATPSRPAPQRDGAIGGVGDVDRARDRGCTTCPLRASRFATPLDGPAGALCALIALVARSPALAFLAAVALLPPRSPVRPCPACPGGPAWCPGDLRSEGSPCSGSSGCESGSDLLDQPDRPDWSLQHAGRIDVAEEPGIVA